MAPLHPFLRKSLFTTKIPMANITMFYYTGASAALLGSSSRQSAASADAAGFDEQTA